MNNEFENANPNENENEISQNGEIKEEIRENIGEELKEIKEDAAQEAKEVKAAYDTQSRTYPYANENNEAQKAEYVWNGAENKKTKEKKSSSSPNTPMQTVSRSSG